MSTLHAQYPIYSRQIVFKIAVDVPRVTKPLPLMAFCFNTTMRTNFIESLISITCYEIDIYPHKRIYGLYG